MTEVRIPLSVEDIIAAVAIRQGRDRGRAIAIEQARTAAELRKSAVRDAAATWAQTGGDARQRAAWISKRTGIPIRTVRRMLAAML